MAICKEKKESEVSIYSYQLMRFLRMVGLAISFSDFIQWPGGLLYSSTYPQEAQQG